MGDVRRYLKNYLNLRVLQFKNRQMEYTDYITEDEKLQITLPEIWSEYEDEEGTYAFFNTEQWTGNLRITPVTLDERGADRIKGILESDYEKYENSEWKELGEYMFLHYSEESKDEEHWIYYWMTGVKNVLLVISFTIPLNNFDTPENEEELELVEEMIESIQFN